MPSRSSQSPSATGSSPSPIESFVTSLAKDATQQALLSIWTDTTLGGYPATRFTFTADADTAACTFEPLP